MYNNQVAVYKGKGIRILRWPGNNMSMLEILCMMGNSRGETAENRDADGVV